MPRNILIGIARMGSRLPGGQTKHGHSKRGNMTRTYRAWARMRQRCLNEKDKDYPNYGGRGIQIHPSWELFSNFLTDMGECPDRLELDRINYNGNYEPANCRWATEQEQSRNRSNIRWIDVDGDIVPFSEACKRRGVHKVAMIRLTRKMSFDAAVARLRANTRGWFR